MAPQSVESGLPPLIAAIHAGDAVAVRAALDGGANPRRLHDGETPLHVAARLGPIEVVAALIEGGALEWQTDAAQRTPLDVARTGSADDRDAIIALLDCTIADSSFRAAVAAIHAGDVVTLAQLIDREPRLLADRMTDPEAYRKRARPGYFADPKLFWYVANNPTTVERLANNIVEVARTMIERGVAQSDLDYTLELVMTSATAREQGLQWPLMRALRDAGATVTRAAIVMTAAHRELEPLRELLENGVPMDVVLAATFGDLAVLRALLPSASPEDVDLAFGLAVINRHTDAARLALDAGAHVDGFLPVHSHSTALHQAAADNDVPTIALLLARGARTDLRDTLWDTTALGWAQHAGHAAAAAALRGDVSAPP